VFLVWSEWTGEERGEGTERVIAEIELLPTPRVSDLASLARRPYSAGVFPEGSLRVDQISAGAYTRDMLLGRVIPTVPPTSTNGGRTPTHAVNAHGVERGTDDRIDFWWELREDGRGDSPAERIRFRVFAGPSRLEGSIGWAVNIELASEARARDGSTQMGVNAGDLPPGFPGGL
jgi:hypothetical protein